MPIERHQEGAAQADEFDTAMKNNTNTLKGNSNAPAVFANNGIAPSP